VKTDKLYLVGFMAAGKSTLARALADRLAWRHEDIDELVEAREGRSITDIFQRSGEPYFRGVEREMLQLILPIRELVVATGGGTFAEPDNRAAINADGISVWLDVPFAEILARLGPDTPRPLAVDRARLEWLYGQRRAAYEQAHIRLDAAGASTTEMAGHLLTILGRK
jgi:shikimate kinase